MMARETGLEPATSGVTGRIFLNNVNGRGYFLAAEAVRITEKCQDVSASPARWRLKEAAN
jgi:hypothetical protein